MVEEVDEAEPEVSPTSTPIPAAERSTYCLCADRGEVVVGLLAFALRRRG